MEGIRVKERVTIIFGIICIYTIQSHHTKFFSNTSSLVTPVVVTYKWVNDDITMSFECVENNNDSRSTECVASHRS